MNFSLLAIFCFCFFHLQEAHASTQSSSPTILDLSWYLIDFCIFFTLLLFFSRQFLLALWRRRRLHIQRQVEHGRRVLRHAEHALYTVENRLRGLPEEIASLRESVFKEGSLRRQRESEGARERIASLRCQAHSQVASKRNAALVKLKEEIVEAALLEAEVALREDHSEQLEDRYQVFSREILSKNLAAEPILPKYQGVTNN